MSAHPPRPTAEPWVDVTARLIGLGSVAVSLATFAAPREVARFFGSFEGPLPLLYATGLRDLSLGALLLSGRAPATWLRVRAVCDATDGLLAAANGVAHRPARARVLRGVAGGLGFSVLDLLLAARAARRPAGRDAIC